MFEAPASAITRTVDPGGDFQAALNAAHPGDEIVLQAGATFTGSFVLPPKPEGPLIVVRSSARLPDRRITPADAPLLPIIVPSGVAPAIEGNGARNWKFDGIRFMSTVGGLYNIIYTHNNATNITFDRILIIGGPDGQRRGIAGNGANITLTRSHIANIRFRGDETAAFGAWDGPGPFTIRDNYLEAAGMSILFGGADSSAPDHIPADILVENNHLTKRLEWKGQGYAIKNNFELKSARRVIVRNNLMERSWTDAQVGYSVVITVHNDGGNSPWACIEDVLFENNIVRDAERGINILGTGYVYPSGRLRRLTIRNNLLITGQGFQIGGEAGEVIFDHNTFANSGGLGVLYKGGVWPSGEPKVREGKFAVEQFTFTNNLSYHNDSGLFGDAVGSGLPALSEHVVSYIWTHNVLANRLGGYTYPPVSWYPTTAEHQANFNADYTLLATSEYRGAANDGFDLGVKWGSNTPSAPPPPPAEVCGDGKDNDGDGQVDEGCAPSPTEVCGDGKDNDGDGQVDEGCAPPPTEVCGDGKDNDGDGQIDEGCAPAPPADTIGPVVTLWNVVQRSNQYKFRIEAVDPSGIATVRVTLDGLLVASGTRVPMEVAVPLNKAATGAHALAITVTDRVGNATVVNRTIMIDGESSGRN